VPLLSAGNWGGMGLHMRGNIEGYLAAGSQQKWLEMHTGTHFDAFYAPEGVALQMRFFDHFLKGIDNGWDKEPPVQLAIRRPDGFTKRMEQAWPIPRTAWTKYYLDVGAASIGTEAPATEASFSYQGMSGPGLRLKTAPFDADTEFTGPVLLRLWVASETADMDIFVTMQCFDAQDQEVAFQGANDAATPISQGWLRVSHRKLDETRSKPYRPYHAHDEVQPMVPGTIYPVDVEIWPMCLVFPKGYRMELLIEGRDFERDVQKGRYKGSGPFLHTDPDDRPKAVFDAANTLYSGGEYESYLLMPFIREG
jgi:predicted acyl esterase